MYRKGTHTNTYIHFFSNQSQTVKQSTISGLYLRALKICDPAFIKEEEDYLIKSFTNLGYPIGFIERAFSKAKRLYYGLKENEKWNKEKKQVLVIPYAPGLEKLVQEDMNKCKLVFSFPNTLKERLSRNRLVGRHSNEDRGGGIHSPMWRL